MLGKKICILYTGGTIGMLKTKNGYMPCANWLTEKLHAIHLFQNSEVPQFDVIEYTNLIDSSNAQPNDWIKVAKDIYKYYDKYDGFVVLHGTDTLAYTASALSFMLKNLNKPVICTGSQIPLSQIRTDTIDNVLDSLIIAANHNIPEVCIYFSKRLLRGNRTQKVDSSAMAAFDSPNFPRLAKVGIDITIKTHLIRENPTETLSLDLIKSPKIAAMRMFPGIDYGIIEHILEPPLEGFILKTYGAGNVPNDKRFLEILKKANDRGIIIVNCTQCQIGSVNMETYAAGRVLLDVGVISGHDLTDEAALTKLFYLFSLGLSNEEIKKYMQENVRGELTKS